MEYKIDTDEIKRWFDIFKTGGQLVEIRTKSHLFNGTISSGYFTDADTLLGAMQYAASNDKAFRDYAAVWFTLNTIHPALYSRQQHDTFVQKAETTADADITHRDWLLIDFDPERPSGISSTDEELAAAGQMADNVRAWLSSSGWSEPVVAMSGNGYHLLYKIDEPNDTDTNEMLKQLLGRLDKKFSTEAVKVDTKNFNAARICKLYGTAARKGSDTTERPHRMARITSVPAEINATPASIIRSSIASMQPSEAEQKAIESERQRQQRGQQHISHDPFDLETWLSSHGIEYRKGTTSSGATQYTIRNCPFCAHPTEYTSAIFQGADGVITYNCFHDNCTAETWSDFRKYYEPDYNPTAWEERQLTAAQQQRKLTPQQHNGQPTRSQQAEEKPFDPADDPQHFISGKTIADAHKKYYISDEKNIVLDYQFYTMGDKPHIVPLKLRAGLITYFAGATSHGKSTMLQNVAVDLLCKGKRVLFYGLEDTEENSIVDMINIYIHKKTFNEQKKHPRITRLCNNMTNADAINEYMNDGGSGDGNASVFNVRASERFMFEGQEVPTESESNFIAGMVDDFFIRFMGYENHKQQLFFFDNSMTSAQLVQHVDRIVDHVKPDAIFIDYMQYLQSDERAAGTKWEDLGLVSQDLIKIAKKAMIPIVSAAQINEKSSSTATDPDSVSRNDVFGAATIAQGAGQFIIVMNSKFVADGKTVKYCGVDIPFGRTGKYMLKLDKDRRGESPAIGIYDYDGDCRYISASTIMSESGAEEIAQQSGAAEKNTAALSQKQTKQPKQKSGGF